jgi:hypothetical protein
LASSSYGFGQAPVKAILKLHRFARQIYGIELPTNPDPADSRGSAGPCPALIDITGAAAQPDRRPRPPWPILIEVGAVDANEARLTA